MADDEETEENETEEGDDEPEETEPTEKFLVQHSKKGIQGGMGYKFEFEPDEDYLRDTYGYGVFTVLRMDYDTLSGKQKWKKINRIEIAPAEGEVPAPKVDGRGGTQWGKKPAIFESDRFAGLREATEQYKQLAAAKMENAFADILSKNDPAAVKNVIDITRALQGQGEEKKSKLEELAEKIIERQLLQQSNPAASLKEQLGMLKDLQAIVGGHATAEPAEGGGEWGNFFKLVPDILGYANKQAELQKEALGLKKKELELRAAQAPPAIQQSAQPLPVLDKFIIQLLQGSDANQLQAAIALNLSIDALRPQVEKGFNVDVLPDEDYNALCELYEQKKVSVDIVLSRLTELGAQNQKLGTMAVLLNTMSGRNFLQNILTIIEELLLPPEPTQTEQTSTETPTETPIVNVETEKQKKKGEKKHASTKNNQKTADATDAAT